MIAAAGLAGIAFVALPPLAAGAATDCAIAANPIVCENALPGDPPSDWEVQGVGDPTIQGFATSMSVNVGQTISFKIDTPSTNYHIDILRLGWYGGDGARMIHADITPSASLPQTQPPCPSASTTDSTTGEIDCGNWSVSASWTVPSDAVSGVYIAHLVRDDSKDPGGDSQIPFVVRDDASHSDILVPTDDATWEAYNNWGGNSLYDCSVSCPSGTPAGYKAAYAVSYNRPFDGAFFTDGGASYLWYAEYQMIQWLEENGYDVSYTDDADLDSQGSLLLNHKTILFSGHDEYWSGGERANVTAARNAGVNLAMFTGNEIFWKTRWAASSDGSGTPYRTLITYKETHFTQPVDPADPPTWTGAWADPRFSPPADGGNPGNALSGQEFEVNAGTTDMTVRSQYSALPIWQNTAVASLPSGKSLTLGSGDGVLGYEWDVDADNGFRPSGEFDLSSTTYNKAQSFLDYGTTTNNVDPTSSTPTSAPGSTMTHNMSLYRASSGALVFGAGTVQWSWGLDNFNAWGERGTEPSGNDPDRNMEQFTVNLLSMMGAQPGTLTAGLVPGPTDTNLTPPTSTISSPAAGSTVADGSSVTINGTAADSAGGVVAGVEISTDGGTTWHPATLTTADGASVNWTYSWMAHGYPSTKLETRAVDGYGNLETPSDATTVNVSCPCSLWGTNVTPTTVPFGDVDSGDPDAIEVGVQFTGKIDSEVTGIRFYKAAANTGTHVGSLWTANGTLLAQGTFTGETASGWQTLTFSSPVVLQAGQTYVAGYYAPNGHYSATDSWFYPAPAPTPLGGATDSSGPWHALAATGSNENGLFAYGNAPAFPTSTFSATNYWVDPVLVPVTQTPGQATGADATAGYGSATVSWTAPTSGGPTTGYTITPYTGGTAQTPTTVSGDPAPTTATVSGLTPGSSYTFTVTASNTAGAGSASAQSNSIVPLAVQAPSAPTGVSAAPAGGEAQVSWTDPSSDGGRTIASYTVTPTDKTTGTALSGVTVSGASATSAKITGLTNGDSYTFTVAATNSVGTSDESSASAAVKPDFTLFDLQNPATTDAGDPGAVNLGVEFTASENGTITGIRFYKSAANTGTHIGSLWTTSGTLLAQASFSNETGSGWQTVTFANPVEVTAGTTYVASYFAPGGHYAATSQGLATAITNGPLTAPASGSVTNGNGVFAYGPTAAFPSTTFGASNYWVDVLYNPGWPPPTAPDAPTAVTAEPAGGEAQVSWADPSNGGSPITGYTVTPTDKTTGTVLSGVTVSGAATTTAKVGDLTNGDDYTFTVAATNSVGTGDESSASAAVTPEDTIFDLQTPGTPDAADTSSVNLGVEFTASQNGTVSGIRFYKSPANTGSHIGSLWTTSGTLLAQGTFTDETASGWQTLIFSSPVAITDNTTYVASYFAPNGHYAATSQGLATAVTNGPLTAPASGSVTSGNGVFAYGPAAAFPSTTFGASNYWVDLLFSPGQATAPPAPTGVTATPAGGEAQVSWTDPGSDGGSAITGYTVTPTDKTTGTVLSGVTVSGASATTAKVTGLSNGDSYTFTVAASNTVGTGDESSASAAVAPENTIFDLQTPGTPDAADTSPINVGIQFTPSQNGTITGIRFYKSAANTGTHVGTLWAADGTQLAQGTFADETASGWQTLIFSSPVAVTAGTTYVASYLAPNGHYAATSQGLATAITNGPLTAPASGSVTNGNGVFAYGSTTAFPSTTFGSSNYWVDVLFNPGS